MTLNENWQKSSHTNNCCVEVAWRKSSHSSGECVEVGVPTTSSYSRSATQGECVEVEGGADGTVLVRHSKRPDAGTIEYTGDEWRAFIAGVKDGEFDLP